MKRPSRRMGAATLLAVIVTAACSTAARTPVSADVQPGAPAGASRAPSSAPTADGGRPRHSGADVQFMQRMMAHHAQALAMTALVPTRSRRDDIRLIAQRIEISQRDEIALMRRWLTERGEPVPSLESHHEHHAPSAGSAQAPSAGAGEVAGGHEGMMPGMLTPEELARLTNATGADFDRLFLQLMIRHHEGALTMVAGFLGTQGAGQEPEIFRFASDVDADQRAEIARMRTLQRPP